MIALLRVELTRLRWRRAVVLLLLAAVVIPALVLAATAWNTRPVSEAERRNAELTVEREAEQPYMQRQLKRCEAKPERWGAAGGGADEVEAACAEAILPQAEWYLTRSPLDLVQEREEGSAIAVAVVLGALMLLLGTTFVGHDWNSGSMSNQLLFEPRRARVWLAKGLTVLAVTAGFAALVLAAYWTGLWAIASSRDLDLPDGTMTEAYQQVLRGAALCGVAGLGGYALTMLFRSTVATLGVMFAVALAGATLLGVLGVPTHHWVLPHNNAMAVLVDGIEFTVWERPGCDGGPRVPDRCVERITAFGGAVYFAVITLAASAASLASFGRRDVP
ncbi:hypothetical protein [Nocardioides ferulae]|uniref:hypothetical protein n=1 Tax=Nocardioides ferulae TaxID=2340821 RepID=UPI000EB4FC91|nr:hypothetical protein [Nocardioides ferulae]